MLAGDGCAIASYHADDLKEGILIQGLWYLGTYILINPFPDNAGHASAGLSSEAAQILILLPGQRNLSSVQILAHLYASLYLHYTSLCHRSQTDFPSLTFLE